MKFLSALIVVLLLATAAHAQSQIGPLQAQNNLADVPNKATALTNLGVNPLGGDLSGTTADATVHTLGGLAIAPSATTDTTNASNITSGLLGCSAGGTGRNTGTAGGLLYWSSTPCSGAQTAIQTSALLTANSLILAGGTSAPSALSSLGTTTTVLHGNAAGAPSWGAVNLGTDVTGSLPLANLAVISTGLLGDASGSAATPSVVTLGSGLSFSGTTLVAQWQAGSVTSLAGGLTLVSGVLTAPVTSVSGTTGQITTNATTGAIVVSLPTTITQAETFSAGLSTTTLAASGSMTLTGLASGTQASCLGLTSGNVVVPLTGACNTINVTLAPGLTSNTGTQNTGTQTLGNGTTLAFQSWPKVETANYTLSYPTDLGTTLVANGSAAITFTLRNPSAATEGTITPIFQDESGHGYTLTTSGATATFYGFSGGGVTSFQFAAYTSVQCRDDGTNYLCAITGTGGGSGSGTVNSGTAGQMAYYAASGTTVSGAPDITLSSGTATLETNTKVSSTAMSTTVPFGFNNASPTSLLDMIGKDSASGTIGFRFRNSSSQVLWQGTDAGALSGMGPITLGLVGTVGGSITLNGLTSGTVQLSVAAAAGTGTVFQLPSANGTSGQFLQTNGAGVTSWATAPGSGTVNSGLVNELAYYAATGSAVSTLPNITVTNTGSMTFGTNGTAGGSLVLNGATSGSVTLNVPAAAGSGTIFTLPNAEGTSGQVLEATGSGGTSWTTLAGGGNMTGPTTSVVGDIVCFNNTVGTLTEDCGAQPTPYTGTNQVLVVNGSSVQGGVAYGALGTVLLGEGSTTTPVFGSLPYSSLSGLPTTANQIIAGNGSTTGLYTLTAGSNVTITQGASTITIASSGGGGGSLAIGSSISGGTAGEMLYVGSGGVLAQASSIPTLNGTTSTQTGTTYTFAATDCGTTVLFTSSSAVTATIPASIVPASGAACIIGVLQEGTAKVSVNGTAVSAATLVSPHSYTGTSGSQGSVIDLTLTTVSSVTDAYLSGDGS